MNRFTGTLKHWRVLLFVSSLCFANLAADSKTHGQEVRANGQASPRSAVPTTTVALYLDTSTSMKGNRATALKEGAKLAIATLDSRQQVVIVSFSDRAGAARFSLRSRAERHAAMQYIDRLHFDGGTNYLAALGAAKFSTSVPGIFLSDGEHNGDPAPVLAHLKQSKSGPLYTVAIESPANADRLLSSMAALTGGNHVRVEHSEALVKVFLELSRNLGNYRSYTPKEERIDCAGVRGKLIALGFDAVPEFRGPLAFGPVYEHQARLPGENVHLAAVSFANPTDLSILATRKMSPRGRLAAILRQDLLQARMKVHAPQGKAGAGTQLKVTTEFFDRQGKPIPTQGRRDLSSDYELLDGSGKIVRRVTGSAAAACFEATIPLPQSHGPVTIRNITKDASRGPAFEATESRTVLLQKPVQLTAQPAKLVLRVTEGPFETSIKIAADKALKASYAASLEDPAAGLRLLSAQSKGDEFVLRFEAGAGKYQGTLLIDGAASEPLATLRVPLDITVIRPALGLAVPAIRSATFGPILANSGKQDITSLQFPGLDGDATPFEVDVEDLSNGSAIIPCTSDQAKFLASKTTPGSIMLSADIGNVASGDYRGDVVVKLLDGTKSWRTRVTLRVSEPLSVTPVDFGMVEVGKRIKRTLVLKNAGGAIQGVRLEKAVIKAKGGSIVVEFPNKVDLPPDQKTEVPVTLVASPLIESRGLHKGSVMVGRTGNQRLVCPLSVDIVDAGKGPCSLLAAPRLIVLTGKSGDVLQFDIRVKLAAGATALSEELTVSSGHLKDAQNLSTRIEPAFKWSSGKTLKRSSPATVHGFLVAPARPGTFSTIVTIRSVESGTLSIPLTLNVQ